MIVDKISNIEMYAPLAKGIKAGMDAVKDLKAMEVGRYEFDGGYFMVQKGTTKPLDEGTFEAHRKYIDVQIILEGAEVVAWADIKDLTTAIEYNPEKDAERFNGDKKNNMLISAGMFYIAFPHDGHKPCCYIGEQTDYTKIVMKLPAD